VDGRVVSSDVVRMAHVYQKTLGTFPEDGNVMPKHVGATNHNKLNEELAYLLGFSRIFLLGNLNFKGLTARRLYKSLCIKGLKHVFNKTIYTLGLCLTVSHISLIVLWTRWECIA
jgi:hypothetical protein